MAGTPLGSSSTSTPPGAASPEDPTRPYDEQMEDIPPQITRKRPRLDSGADSRESMSTGESPVQQSASPRTPNDQELSSSQTLSRVTINMKSPSQPGVSIQDISSAEEFPREEDGIELDTTDITIQQPEDTLMAGAQSSTAISISSSPSRSPEIEVAEVEDMDQDPNTSRWRPLGEAVQEQSSAEIVQVHEQFSLADQFPKLRGNPDLRESLEETASIIEKGHPHEMMILNAVKQWLAGCIDNLSQVTLETMRDDREFWEDLPSVVEGLLRRQIPFQQNQGPGTLMYLEEFFLDFGQLALHMLRLDTSYLTVVSQTPSMQPSECISRPYVQCLAWLLQVQSIPFYRALIRIYQSKVMDFVAQICDHVADAPLNALQNISEYITLLLPLLPRFPQLAQFLLPAVAVVSNLLESRTERRKLGADEQFVNSSIMNRTIKDSYPLFRKLDEAYQTAVTKKAPWLTADISENLSRYINTALRVYCDFDTSFASKLAGDLSIDIPEYSSDESASIVIYAWKFNSLKRHIMDGRMELRVWGTETMQLDLVGLWRQKIQNNPDGVDSPLVQYLLKFLRDIRIIEYIVGVGSHPQIISRAGNIVGFFIVTNTYTDADTDILWRAVTDSQDQRTVGEIITMLGRTIVMHPSTSRALLYLCSKLLELPMSRFDQRMIEFCDLLFRNMRDKFEENQHIEPLETSHLDSTPLRICVRLIRESNSCPDISDEQKVNLQRFAGGQLQQLLNLGMSESDKRDVYERCIQDIGERNEFASGSIQALNSLIPTTFDSQEIRALATDYELTALVIMEFEQFWGNIFEVSDRFSQNAVVSRVHLLGRLIDKVPDTITPELSDTLWTKIFMAGNIQSARSSLWDMLCRVTKICVTPNSFIERCLHDYLPSVSPENYSPEIISFAEHAVHYEIRFNPPPVASENEIITLPGMDRIWHFILTAPPDTIEERATTFAIEVYLDHNLIRRAPASAAEATHISLVDRCVDQIKSAALTLKGQNGNGGTNSEDDAMVMTASEREIASAGLKLSRSLLFLQQLLQGLRSRPQYSPPQSQAPELPERVGQGETVEISYQSFNESKQSRVCTLRIGSLCTAADLVNRLTRVTGFKKFSVIYGGQRVNLLENPEMTVQDLNFKGLLIIRKTPDGTEVATAGRRQSLTLVDSEILKHFDDLYDLLDLDDRYAHEIYDFLIVFPPQERVKELVRTDSNTEDTLFPMEKPYKLLYSVKALSRCLREELLETETPSTFIVNSTQVLVGALTRPEMSVIRDDCMNLVFALNLLECLLLCLSDLPALPNAEALVGQLLFFIKAAQKAESSRLNEFDIQRLICHSISVLIDASVLRQDFWDMTKQHAQFEKLIFSLLLEEKRQSIRRQVAEKIKSTCNISTAPNKAANEESENVDGSTQSDDLRVLDIVSTIWDSFVKNMQKTVPFSKQSQEYFSAAIWTFRSVAERSSQDVDFSEYVSQWSESMLGHETEEFVGREPVDHVILGFARLLRLCLEVAGKRDTTINATVLIESLVNNYLFPDLSEPSDTEAIQPRIPVMNEDTREELYKILILLCKQEENFSKVIDLMSDLIPRDFTYNTTWAIDRLKAIRSPEGYAGLKNLSNTCYLNSLFTQLFMNVGFRDFMLQVALDDPQSSQKLLAETKKIFGNMQETWCKYVDPDGAVCSIRTYDNEPIDVNVQMDVDEFYNLLFDRWEAQITDPEEKKKFRSFYGGQLVQQIKSKECEHISERLEPFSAIQCDIKGKANLEESLQAYVEGEIMQGDNKYSCTSCGRHVDAVKRACLKEIPDNLIFHLKRFDFDMLTMMRSKINDEFQFPERIDMTPYKVEYLSDSDMQLEQDLFELVGVLVHSGTAESGHYYSYVRERPAAGTKTSWVEFNDADVTSFDPSKIAEQCFGGSNDYHGQSMGPTRFGKVWNAYMLFYQRVSSMDSEKELYKPVVKDTPVHVPLPLDLANYIAMENEIFIRAYCLLDPYHAYFVRCLLQFSKEFVLLGTTASAGLQKATINVAMDTFDQLISRPRELPELDRMSHELKKILQETPKGALRIVEWIRERDTGLRNLILKGTQSVRNVAVKIFIMSLVRVQELSGDETLDESERTKWQSKCTDCWQCIVGGLSNLWPILYTASRSWDDYFEFLVILTTLQSPQINVLLDNGFLLKCLEMVWLDRDDSKNLKSKYPNYYRLLERGRKFSHRKLMELLAHLLKFIDLTLPPTPDDESRTLRDGRYSLTITESTFVFELGRENNGELVFVKKILQHQINPAAIRSIISILLDAEPQANLTQPIIKVLEDGLRASPAQLCAPYLEAALVFCSRSPSEQQVIEMIDYIAKGVESINNSGGREHITFFSNVTTCRNERIGKDESWFTEKVVERIPEWVPTLLIYLDRSVKTVTFDMLRETLFNQDRDDVDDEYRAFYIKVARELAQACVEVLRKTYLANQGHTVENKVVDNIRLVITHCLREYYDEDDADDAEVMQQAEAVLGAIEQLTVDVPEEIASASDFASPEEWEDQSIMGSDSELGMPTP
ncbi:ubiquitin C-terminal hydrolase, putative [Talaromyces stipitatus ATCC 10500]|uniref:Ubiquitin C-terminal hydrolase, putative n=1 Tax=Talaromyces stipitatus (strain ATCC 10500 / CBS 375.48 / QM 6759 / NRRL 1006) TaxID=441959 RepID=B8M1H9_TALSN|nr:ubiquitin C-terminal hydrolase, putative [Talaromyces stipitatus ATCC 10500]EED21875.1 ubiquitin C-terminal hydrolase, putative [Talaromyces stipitatus ATCC 10500]